MTDGTALPALTPASSTASPPVALKLKRKANTATNRTAYQKRARVQAIQEADNVEPNSDTTELVESDKGSNPPTPIIAAISNTTTARSSRYSGVTFNFIANEFVQSKTRIWIPVHDPV